MQFTAAQLSEILNGTIEGNPQTIVSRLSKIEEGGPESLTFLANPKYENYLYSTLASIVIINNDLKLERPISTTLIRVPDAYLAFSKLLDVYNTLNLNKTGIEEPSYIHPTASIGKDNYIGAFAYIGQGVKLGNNVKIYPHCYIGDNVSIGDNTVIFSGVKIYHDCIIGKHVVIHSSTVIGSDGFGFAPQADGSYSKVSQIGNVIIEDNVEVGSNVSIDRATMGSTILHKGVKLDNLIQIAHNVEIGQNTVVASQAGISGSTKIGENSIIGGQVGIVGHINIAKGSKINAQSGIAKTIKEENEKWSGSPAVKFLDNYRSQAVLRRLPDLEKRIEELEQILKELRQATV